MTRYVGVVFEKGVMPFNESEETMNFYKGERAYTYKTETEYKEGQVVWINHYGVPKKVIVVSPSIEEKDITFPLDKIKDLRIVKEV